MLKYVILLAAILQFCFALKIEDIRNEFSEEYGVKINELRKENDEFRNQISHLLNEVQFLKQELLKNKATEEERLDKLEQETRAYGNN